MERLCLLACAALLFAGCRTDSNANPYDPFLGRPVVPAPGTVAPSGPQPYYPATGQPPAAVVPAVTLPSTTASPGANFPSRGATAPNPSLSPPSGFNSTQFIPQLSPDPVFTPGKATASGFTSTGPGERSPTDNIRLDPSGVVVVGPPPATLPTATSSTATAAAPTVVQTAYAATVDPPAAAPSNSAATSSQASSQIRILTSAARNDGAASNAAASAAPPVAAGPTIVAAVSRAGAAYSYDPNYHSLEGKLEHYQNGQWKLRYIPLDGDTDAYGGSVVLASASTLDKFQVGDFVSVQGSVAQNSNLHGYAPLFDLSRIQRQ